MSRFKTSLGNEKDIKYIKDNIEKLVDNEKHNQFMNKYGDQKKIIKVFYKCLTARISKKM